MRTHFALRQSVVDRSLVSVELRYGTWHTFFVSAWTACPCRAAAEEEEDIEDCCCSAIITSLSDVNDLLILIASTCTSPTAPLRSRRSLPARSTSASRPLSFRKSGLMPLTVMDITQCDRDERSFELVHEVLLVAMARFTASTASSNVLGFTSVMSCA